MKALAIFSVVSIFSVFGAQLVSASTGPGIATQATFVPAFEQVVFVSSSNGQRWKYCRQRAHDEDWDWDRNRFRLCLTHGN